MKQLNAETNEECLVSNILPPPCGQLCDEGVKCFPFRTAVPFWG